MEKQAESDSTSIRWTLRVKAGSAQISSIVRSGPTPASDKRDRHVSDLPEALGRFPRRAVKIFRGSAMVQCRCCFRQCKAHPASPELAFASPSARNEFSDAAAVTDRDRSGRPSVPRFDHTLFAATPASLVLEKSARARTIAVLPLVANGATIDLRSLAGAHSTTMSATSQERFNRNTAGGLFSLQAGFDVFQGSDRDGAKNNPSIPSSSASMTLRSNRSQSGNRNAQVGSVSFSMSSPSDRPYPNLIGTPASSAASSGASLS